MLGCWRCRFVIVFAGIGTDVVFTKMLFESSALETFKIFVPDGPESSAQRPISDHLTEDNGCAKDVSDAIHPCSFASLEVRIDDCDPFIYLL